LCPAAQVVASSSLQELRVRFEPERTGTPFLFFFSPERRSGPFRHIAAKFNKPVMNNIQQNKGVRMTANFRCFQVSLK